MDSSLGGSLTVACWNTEWHSVSSPKGRGLKASLLAIEPDLACLPEAQHNFLADTYHGIHSHPDSGYPVKSGRSKVTLWSRGPWADVDTAGSSELPPGRFVSGTTDTSIGPIRVVGICIPYRHAHVSNGERNRRVWEDHRRYIEALPEILERERRHGPVLLVGDFNQRIPARWVPPELASMLRQALTHFHVWTDGGVAGLEKQLVCHIAGTQHFNASGGATGLPRRVGGIEVSDHDGVVQRLTAG